MPLPDLTETLANLAAAMPAMPLEGIESLLLSFDAVLAVNDPSGRPCAAALLSAASARCGDPAARDRLLRAAEAVAAGAPCAAAEPAAPVREEVKTVGARAEALPHLPVRHFFPGLVVRAVRDFETIPAGAILTFQSGKRTGRNEFTLTFREHTVKLALDDARLQNSGNQWFEPVPTIECLQELWTLVDERFEDAALDEPDIRDDLDDCDVWLFAEEDDDRGPTPRCESGEQASAIFGADNAMAYWLPLLFAGVASHG
jgi:hypothetical protein